MFPILIIVLGAAVLAFGRRLAVLGAAVGGLLGVVLLRLFPGSSDLLIQIGIVIALALAGFFAAAFARGIIDVVILVLGALAGAAIVLGLLDLFGIDLGLMNWLLAVVGGVVGLMLIRRSRRRSRDWGMVILAGLIGGLLVTRWPRHFAAILARHHRHPDLPGAGGRQYRLSGWYFGKTRKRLLSSLGETMCAVSQYQQPCVDVNSVGV